MEKYFAYQRDSRPPCKYGRKCFQKNKEHIDTYKHPPMRNDVETEIKNKARKRDSKGKVKLNNTNSSEESSHVSNGNNEEDHVEDMLTDDLEVTDQLDNSVVESEASNNTSTNNQHNSTEYIVPPTRQQTQQQQLLLTNTSLEDCCGDDGIVPCTPTLFTPRRLDGETVSSPHVPSSSQVNRFTFVGESQASQISDLNDGEPGPSTPTNTLPKPLVDPIVSNKLITRLFLVGEMPKEFYDLWNFCKRQCPLHPEDALLPVGLKLVGPYDVLAGRINDFDVNNVENNVLHWRYYYDPPEFQTILASTDSEFHIGYFRDQPLEMPVYIVSNDSDKDCIIQKLGKSLFLALRKHLHNKDGGVARTLEKQLLAYEKRKVKQILDGRSVNSVAPTFHKAGIVVPYDSKTDVGYRPLHESGKTLRNILKCYREASDSKKVEAMDKIQPIITYANIASDECDFGTGLELGINLFCDGNPELHRICKQLLSTAYNLLRRPEFATIIKAHLSNRRKGQNMSIL